MSLVNKIHCLQVIFILWTAASLIIECRYNITGYAIKDQIEFLGFAIVFTSLTFIHNRIIWGIYVFTVGLLSAMTVVLVGLTLLFYPIVFVMIRFEFPDLKVSDIYQGGALSSWLDRTDALALIILLGCQMALIYLNRKDLPEFIPWSQLKNLLSSPRRHIRKSENIRN